MASLELTKSFWRDRAVLVTGHTGFKGSWLSLWLQNLGARVFGFALEPATDPALFEIADVGKGMSHQIGNLNDSDALFDYVQTAQPEVVIHLAAQALIKEGYRDPVGTVSSNVMGLVHLLEATRRTPSVRAVLVVTSDKCYENREWLWPYRENEPLGGRDPYSASKACAEIIATAWRSSFPRKGLSIATARAGNVIGGGDWAADRLVPDAIRAWEKSNPLLVRNPDAIRPWQHVLEPLYGYLLLAERLYAGEATEAWNFGPAEEDMLSVEDLLERLAHHWGPHANWIADSTRHSHEAGLLRLDSSKARRELGWRPKWRLDQALDKVVSWQRALYSGADMRQYCLTDIDNYEAA